ncbi:MAG TPA: hypothetical protein VER96_15780 [Polyangiaceae bacterium]|nr:hypothetical protein [Polyangiaceae bacterium]
MAEPAQSDFRRAFQGLAKRVHRRHAGRLALTGASLGLSLGALGTLGMWALRLGEWRPAAAGLGVVGAIAGALLANRRRWSERDVALYLDARLASHETVTTALDARSSSEPALAHVLERASSVLGSADPKRVKPRLWSRIHALLPAALLGIGVVSLLPLPPAPPPTPHAPGAERVQIENLKGLERIEALARLQGQNPEQDERLKKLAEQAKKLRESLAKGLEKREALSEIAKLRDGIAAEQLKLGDRQNRPGLDAALRAFSNHPALRDAQKALGNGDLTAFDDEMQKLANRAESSDRQAAKDALEEAAKEARAKGAKGLADALDAQKRLFERRESHADALRELAQGMKGKLSPEELEDLKEFGSSGNPEAEKRLADALEHALEGLTPEERKRLAERMQRQLESEHGNASPMTKRQLEEMAKQLARKEGLEQLEKQLKELAKPEPSDDAKREQGLGDAERGGSEAQRGLGAVPIPMDGDGAPNGSPGGKPGSPGNPGQGDKGSTAGPGSKHDTGIGDHQGSTPEIAAKELRSKAEARLQAGAPMHGATLGRAPARAGETANQLGTGSLGDAQKTEVGAVDHADIPEEYREQVGRYFEP